MELFDYQKKVAEEAKQIIDEHGFVILTLAMRCGKSPISLTIADGKILFFTAKSAIPDVEETAKLLNKDVDVMSYDSAHKITDTDYDFIVFDEAHKVSSFPKLTARLKKVKAAIDKQKNNPKFILMSGTPASESNSQWFHPLWLTGKHPFSEFKNFYRWADNFVIKREKNVGYGRMITDYSETINFIDEYIRPYQITLTREETGMFEYHTPKINPIYLTAPRSLYLLNMDILSKGIAKYKGIVVKADNGASKMIKMQQIISGHVIDENEIPYLLSRYKVEYLLERADKENDVIFYKYRVMQKMLKDAGFKNVHNIDYTEGLDFSHHNQIWVAELTFKTAAWQQAVDRMAKFNRDSEMIVNVLIAKDSIETYIYEALMRKKDFGYRYYLDKI